MYAESLVRKFPTIVLACGYVSPQFRNRNWDLISNNVANVYKVTTQITNTNPTDYVEFVLTPLDPIRSSLEPQNQRSILRSTTCLRNLPDFQTPSLRLNSIHLTLMKTPKKRSFLDGKPSGFSEKPPLYPFNPTSITNPTAERYLKDLLMQCTMIIMFQCDWMWKDDWEDDEDKVSFRFLAHTKKMLLKHFHVFCKKNNVLLLITEWKQKITENFSWMSRYMRCMSRYMCVKIDSWVDTWPNGSIHEVTKTFSRMNVSWCIDT